MEVLIYLFEPVLMILRHEFEIFGYTISFLQIFILSCLSGIAGIAISKLFGGY